MFAVRDIVRLLALYGVAEQDVRAEILAAVAQDTGETAWIVRAGGLPRRQAEMAGLESGTRRIRQYQPVLVPGLLQTREYAWHVAKACGAIDPDAVVETRMHRQQALHRQGGASYEVVLDARALLLRTGPPETLADQATRLADHAVSPRIDLRVIPIGALSPVFAATGFAIYEFRDAASPSVVWVESTAGDSYFSAPEDVEQYVTVFNGMQDFALCADAAISYLRSFAENVNKYLTQSNPEER